MFFQKLINTYLSLCAVVCGVYAIVAHDLLAGVTGLIVGTAVNVCIVLESRQHVFYRGDTSSFVTDESRREYERPESTRTIDIAPIVIDWSIGPDKVIELDDDEPNLIYLMSGESAKPIRVYSSHEDLILPVHNCECVYCEVRRKSRYDEAEDD